MDKIEVRLDKLIVGLDQIKVEMNKIKVNLDEMKVPMNEMEVQVGVMMRGLGKLGEHCEGTNESLRLLLARQEEIDRWAKAME